MSEGIVVEHNLADILVVADDLSGAAEAAAALVVECGLSSVPVHLLPGKAEAFLDRFGPVVIDTNSRYSPVADLPQVLSQTLRHVAEWPVVVKKIDSLLRGNFAEEVKLMLHSGRSAVLSPALPSSGRTVRQGQVFVDGKPLHETMTWAIEAKRAPVAIRDLFPGVRVRHVFLDIVRGPESLLARAIGGNGSPEIIVCDAETDEDLERIARASLQGATPPPILVGSSAMTAAVGRILSVGAPGSSSALSGTAKVAFLVGTAEPSAHRQVARLEAEGCVVLTLDPSALIGGQTMPAVRRAVSQVLKNDVAAITLDPAIAIDHGHGPALVTALADAVNVAIRDNHDTAFVITGGQTARAVLDALGTGTLTVHGTVDFDAALGTTDAGIRIVTRPGSFGREDSFVRILHGLVQRQDA